MAYPPITVLPVAPSRQRPETFADESDAFLSAMVPFGTDVNGAGTYFDAGVVTATAAAATAVSSAATAVSNSTASAASAIDANTSKNVAAGSVTAAAASANSASASKDLAYTYSQNAASAVAYQDLTAIAASKAVTAVDVFVYDTSKDTDGGAWRKRTQGTSWYNEPLNTAFRGSRKEFPAVAVISVTVNTLTIYDGDDPAVPMWMVFSNGGTNIASMSGDTKNSLAMKNARLVIGSNLYDVKCVDFAGDRGARAGTTTIYGPYKGNVSERNSGKDWITSQGSFFTSGPIINRTVNDVSMTVLPDAPIDPATGLQIPTIAVGCGDSIGSNTGGGASVILADGTVKNFTPDSGAPIGFVDILPSGKLVVVSKIGGGTQRRIRTYDISTGTLLNYIERQGLQSTPALGQDVYTTINGLVATESSSILSATSNGLASLSLNKPFVTTTASQGMVAYTASSYTSGWMPGAIKGAFLADTDATALVGSGELVTNGDFATNTDWTLGTGWTIGGGTLNLDASVSGAGVVTVATQNITTVVGESYVTTATVSSAVNVNTNEVFVRVNDVELVNNSGQNTSQAGAGVYTVTFVATSTSTAVLARTSSTTAGNETLSISLWTVKLADADRSVNNKGLVVNGTITRTPVATGAELVGYSGFSAANFLEQPYNAGLDFGTGDFSIMGWMKGDATGRVVFERSAGNALGHIYMFGSASNTLVVRLDNSNNLLTSSALPTTIWNQIVLVRKSGILSIYLNGVFDKSVNASTQDLSAATSPVFRLGQGVSVLSPLSGSLALWRISATAPSPAQIAKIYRDELPLFQAGAACTLYGTSNAVTALAHDDTTDLLHVGTSAGRSVFDGLRRVSNTTTAVGTAISASNNLIVEE
jgi:hypothetical protein